MKRFKSATFLVILMLCAVFCKSQTKSSTRYFQAIYVGVDSTGHLKYGTYYFTTEKNYFPTREEVNKIIVGGYKLAFAINDPSFAVTICEFKNKNDWLKWNHK